MPFFAAVLGLILLVVIATLWVRWHRDATVADRRRAMLARLDRRGHAKLANELAGAWELADEATDTALACLADHVPAPDRARLNSIRGTRESSQAIILAVARAERILMLPGYVHLRHDIRKVQVYADKALRAAPGIGGRDSGAAATTTREAIKGLQTSCANLHRIVRHNRERCLSRHEPKAGV